MKIVAQTSQADESLISQSPGCFLILLALILGPLAVSANAQITDAVSREISVFNFGQATIANDAVSREVSVFNLGQSTTSNDAVSREVSVFNAGQSTVSSDAVSREVSVFNVGQSTVGSDVVSREVSVFNAGQATVSSDAVSREVSVRNFGEGAVATNSCNPPPSGLVDWWPGQGNATDIIGGDNGTPTNGVSYGLGEVGVAFELASNSAMVIVGNPTNLQLQNFTIEAWVQRGSTSSSSSDLIAVGGGAIFGYGHGGYSLGMNQSGVIYLTQVDSGGVFAGTGIIDTNWHHVAVTTSAGTVVFYIDGVAYPAGNYNPTYQFTTLAAIGGRADNINGNNNDSFLGGIDEVSVYNRALSADEIATIYQTGAAGKCPELATPVLVQEPVSQAVLPGGVAVLGVRVMGSTPLTYQWQLNGTNLTDNGRITGSTSNVLTIANIAPGDAGNYAVTVTNLYGSATSTPAALTLTNSLTFGFSGQLQTFTVPLGVSQVLVTITGAAGGIGGNDAQPGGAASPQLQATANLAVAPASQMILSVGGAGGNGTSGNGTGGLPGGAGGNSPLAGYGGGNGGAEGPSGWSGSGGGGGAATVLVMPDGGSIVIGGGGGAGGGGDNSAGADGIATAEVMATNSETMGRMGASHPGDGGGAGGGGGGAVGGTGGAVVASCDCGADAGAAGGTWLPTNYLAAAAFWVTNYGTYGGNGSITVTPVYDSAPPLINGEPVSQSVLAGTSAKFSVSASGTAPLSYQWQLNGTNLADNGRIVGSSSNVLNIASVLAGDAGSYSVIVTNLYGSATSDRAVLVVTNSPQTGIYDLVADFSTNANPNGVWSYGRATEQGAPFQLLTNSVTYGVGDFGWWSGDAVPYSVSIDRNYSGATIMLGSEQSGYSVFDTNTLQMDPEIEAAVVRFTAPGSALYSVSGFFQVQDTITHPHYVGVLINGSQTNFYAYTSGGYNSQYRFSFTTSLLQGQTVDFVVSCNDGDYSYLGTGVKAVIIMTNTPVTTSCDPPPAGLVGWWPGDGNAADVFGGNNGTLEGGASYAAGEVGQAFDFNGGYVQLSGTNIVGGARTFEGWIYANASTGLGMPVFVGGSSGAGDFFGVAGTSGDGNIRQYNLYIDHWGTACIDGGVVVTPNAWNHVAVTYDGAVLIFYVNGVAGPAINRTLYDYPLNSGTIGGNVIGGSTTQPAFNGLIDEFSIYNRALSAAEIQAIYQAGAAGKCSEFAPPVIVQQPASQTNSVGGEVTFSVSASGTAPLSYQWAWNGTNLAGATNASLVLSDIQFTNFGGYSVVVSNAFGSADSVVATLDVAGTNLVRNGNFATGDFTDWVFSGNVSYNGIDTASDTRAPGAPPGSAYFAELGPDYPPIVMSQTISTLIGDSYTFSFYIARSDNNGVGSGSPASGSGAEFTASFGGEELFDTLDTHIDNWTLESYTVVAAASTETVQFTAVSPPGYYYLGDISVTDNGPAGTLNSSPWLIGEPSNVTTTSGGNAVLQVAVAGAPPLSYQWLFNGTNLTDNAQTAGSQSNALTLAGVTFENAGVYEVVVTNTYGSTNAFVTLTVAPATPIISWANPAALTYGTALDTNQLDAAASVPGTLVYNPPPGSVLNAGNETLSVTFMPVDTNDYSSATASVTLVVNPAPLTVTANNATRAYGQANPGFTGALSGLVNGDTITARYSCSAVALSPPGAYPIVPSLSDPNNRLGNYTVLSNNGTLTVSPGPPPTLAGITPSTGLTNGGTVVTIYGSGFELGAGVDFGGQPASNVVVDSETQLSAVTPPGLIGATNVVVGNPDGTMAGLTNAFTYTGTPPSFLVQPAGALLVQGDTAVFTVTAQYAAAYQWYFNGGALTDNGRIAGAHGPVLTIPAVQATDVGAYQVIITNAWGSALSAPAALAIVVPPAIGIPPQNLAVGVGATATFTVGVNGTAPFAYQWLAGGSPVAGATNAVLTVPNVQLANQGRQYSVVVSNAAGMVTSPAATLTVLNYCASAQPLQSIYPMGGPVALQVQTFNCGSQAAVANSSATVWISTGGTVRSFPVVTAGSGTTFLNFAPLPTETGTYQVAAALPGQSVPAAQGTFTIVGLGLSQNGLNAALTPGVPVTNTITLKNLTGVPLTGIAASVAGSAPDVQVTLQAPATLNGNATGVLSVVLLAPGNTAAQDQFAIQLTTGQGTTNSIPVTAGVVPTLPQLTTIPGSLAATMVGGGQTLVNFYVANTGGVASGPLQLLLPAVPWLTAVTPLPLPPLAPGQSNVVTLALTPPANLPLGAYPGTVELTDGHAQLSVPFQFDCVSELKGALQVTVQDELSYYGTNQPDVSNATITVTDFLTGSNVTSAVTDASGMVLFSNLTSAYYTVSVTAPDHGDFSTTLLLAADQTNDVTAFLDLNLVDYTWLVTPTVVPDHYIFTLQTTFATEVPWPVVTVAPGAVDLCDLQGQSTQVDLTITNSGLIAAQGMSLYFGPHPDWSLQPLATNLGDLLPESSLIVPVLVTRTGAATDVPDTIPAQLTYHVAAVNTTQNTTVPIYVFDANPLDCEPQNPSPGPGLAGGGGGGGGGGAIVIPHYSFQTPQAALVEVKLQILQNAVIAANAFNASLQLVNNAGTTISNLSVTITVYDASNQVANTLFGLPPPALNGLNAVDGTGVLAAGATGSAAWTIVPTTNAAPVASTPFSVGGSFSYTLNGEPVTVPLYAVPITVLPTPILDVDYFLQHDVYSDDPFTPQIEPSVPFALGLLVHNAGYGGANDFTITSAQPQIIENSNDLLIAFQLIGSQAGTNQSISPSFTLDFGDLGPQATADGLWYLTSTLEGQFISFSATYQHVNDFGNTNTSVINRVRIHEMNHVVRLTEPVDDGLPDYLVNDTTNVDALPGIVYSSDNLNYPVTSITDATTVGSPTPANTNITVTLTAPPGWVYVEVVDPGAGVYPITSVTRSDGTRLLVGPNVWQTPARPHMVPPKPDNLIHIFDYNSTGSYTVTYGRPILPPVVTTVAATEVTPTSATLNALVNPDGASTEVYFQYGLTTNYGGATATTTLTGDLNTPQAVGLAAGSLPPDRTNHFRAVAVNSAGIAVGSDLTMVTPPLPPPAIVQVTNQTIVVGQPLVISNRVQVATPPAIFSLDGSDPDGATISTNGVFKWTPACLQGSSTNLITIWVRDSGTPPLSNSMTFAVVIGECVQLEIGSAVMQAGQTGAVSVTLLSTVGLTNINWTLNNPAGRFTNWVFAASNAAIASVTSTQAFFKLSTAAGQTLQSPALLGAIRLRALPGPSAFVSLVASNILGGKLNGGVDGDIASEPGRVVVIGAQPLLEPLVGTNSTRLLTLYGNPGTNYELLVSTNLAAPGWRSVWSGSFTNLYEQLTVDPTAPRLYFRARSP